jgi:hypothetical protein
MVERIPEIRKIRLPERVNDFDGVKIGEGKDVNGNYELVCISTKPGLPSNCIGHSCPIRKEGKCKFIPQ